MSLSMSDTHGRDCVALFQSAAIKLVGPRVSLEDSLHPRLDSGQAVGLRMRDRQVELVHSIRYRHETRGRV